MNISFPNRVIVVAGGTGGLGRTVSLAFLQEGAKVTVTYREEEEFRALKDAAGQHASSLEGRPTDVTDEAAATELIHGVVARHGALHLLVNTVGGYAGGVKLWDLTTKVFDQMLALNLRSGYTLARAAMPAMLKAGPGSHGSIVNVAAKAAFDHAAGAAAYAASKAAAVALMDCLAADAKGTGIRVNTILPSIIDTPANRLAMPGSDFAAWPKPEDIAQVILFLSSDLANTIHGAAVPAYGNA